MKRDTSFGLREARVLGLKGYPGDLRDTYFDGTLLGAVGGVISIAAEGGDQVLRKLSGRAYEAPKGIMGRTRRDIAGVFNHAKEGEYVQAASAAWSVVAGDIFIDGYDALTGRHDSHSLAA